MSLVKHDVRKSMLIRPSGRSTDYISPSFGWGCLFSCAYCYMKRNKPEGLSIATNVNEILTAIDHHAWFADVEKPNQTHPEYVTYDISCNEDFALHAKYHDWEKVFKFFRDHPKAMGSFATKYVNTDLLEFDPQGKIRIRFSLMPEDLREILEPNTSSVNLRLNAVPRFIDAGYEVHLNFSPVIVHENWLHKYELLFSQISKHATYNSWDTDDVKAEVIFLTHNEKKHEYNLANNLPGEDLLWRPEIQEAKVSQYGGDNIRYNRYLKAEAMQQFVRLHDEIIPFNKIRYIF
jgi:spore photoproduct lyase